MLPVSEDDSIIGIDIQHAEALPEGFSMQAKQGWTFRHQAQALEAVAPDAAQFPDVERDYLGESTLTIHTESGQHTLQCAVQVVYPTEPHAGYVPRNEMRETESIAKQLQPYFRILDPDTQAGLGSG